MPISNRLSHARKRHYPLTQRSMPFSLSPKKQQNTELLRNKNNEGTFHTSVEIYCCDNNVTCSTCIDMFAPSSKSALVVSAVFSFGFLLGSEHSLSPCSLLLFLETCTRCCSCWYCVTDPISSMWYVQSSIQVGFTQDCDKSKEHGEIALCNSYWNYEYDYSLNCRTRVEVQLLINRIYNKFWNWQSLLRISFEQKGNSAFHML